MTLTVTFKIGTDPDLAQQLVQNRVNQAEPRLPEEVRRLGVTTVKSAVDLTMVVHLVSPSERYDMTYLRNYGVLNVKDRLARIEGVGQVLMWGSGDYSMRVWLDPRKVAERNLSAGDVVRAIRQENVQAAAGTIGASPVLKKSICSCRSTRRGVCSPRRSSATSSSRAKAAPSPGCATSRASSSAPRITRCARCSTTSRRWRSAYSRRPAPTRCRSRTTCAAPWARSRRRCPKASTTRSSTTRRSSCAPRSRRWSGRLLEATALVVLVVILFLQTWRASIIPLVAVPVSIVGTFSLLYVLRLLDQRAQPVRAGARHRHRGGRRHRGGGERRAQHRRRA